MKWPLTLTLERLQFRVGQWVLRTFGEKVLYDQEERGLRHVEEAIELAQALNVSRDRVLRLVNVVYDKPVGEVEQEIAGSLVTLLALGNALKINVLAAGEKEVVRIENLPPDYFRKRNIAKAAAGVGNYGRHEEKDNGQQN